MGLRFPPASTITQFRGGFKGSSDFTDLNDTETNDAKNVEYTKGADIKQRGGGDKLLNVALTSNGGATGRPIVGHFFFEKLDEPDQAGTHIVVAGDSVYEYSSSTASIIRSGMTDDSETYWSFCQIQDPRSASDDILLMANGVDPIQVWNGSATAVVLNAFTSASGVPIGKYILQHENRVYLANITDTTDIDAGVKVERSGFGNDGAPNPHIFRESFYIGGSSRDGQIQGQEILQDSIVYYLAKSIWRFNPGLGDVNDLQKVVADTGLLAPRSLKSIGDVHVFLSERGVMLFDGTNLRSLSGNEITDYIFDNAKRDRLKFAVAEFNPAKNQYTLYFASGSSNRNDLGISYDFNLGIWQPIITGRRVSFLSNYINSDFNQTKLIWGDYFGYLYQDDVNKNDGPSSGYNGVATGGTTNTLEDTSATFSTSNDGLRGLVLRIYEGTGDGQERVITSNTATEITVEGNWSTIPDTTSKYTVAGIDSYWRSKDYALGAEDVLKVFKSLNIRAREEGNINLDIHYIVDFKKLEVATRKQFSLLDKGMVWGVSTWGGARWGRIETLIRRFLFRNTNNQRIKGSHIALRFSNERANEEWTLRGFDLEFRPVGKR